MLKYLLFFIFLGIELFSQTIPISDIRKNDADGVSVLDGTTVTVQGTVTAAKEFGSSGPVYLQDSTGGIAVYGSSFAGFMSIGDSVSVTAGVTNYNGLTEINFISGSKFQKFGKGSDVSPIDLTIDDILNQNWNGFEEYEGSLVHIKDVEISGSGVFEASKNYTISDATGSLEMRIDNSVSSIIGTSIPQSTIDLIGEVGQYKTSAPYNSGYQILPRFVDDLIISNEPLIIQPVVASSRTLNSFKVYFNTVNEGNTVVLFGKTEALSDGEIKSDSLTKTHSVLIDNLEPKTRYYYQAKSSNSFGTSISDIQSTTTLSGDTTYGKINVYFNSSVDHSVAIPGNEANGDVDFQAKVIERINSAQYSLDIALYSFDLENVAQAIIAAKNRGVLVRVVYDSRTIQPSMQLLIDAGIDVIQRPASLDGIMHNKFMVVDGRDTEIGNDWVWCGSWNWTKTELDWRNNVIEINNSDIAMAYQTEFQEMWGGDSDTPDELNSKFGKNKTDNTQHEFEVNGIPIQIYFSPSDQTESKIVSNIATADTSIYFAVLAFTSNPIGDIIETRFNSGVNDLKGIITDANNTGSEFQRLSVLAPNDIFDYNLSGKLHHKYGIVDASYPFSSPEVISGSHNWSASANQKNDENTVFISDIYIANQYMQEFKSRYNDLGGNSEFHVPVITSIKEKGLYPSSIKLEQNYPNPFNPVTNISFFVPSSQFVELNIYNVLGQKVMSIFNGEAKAGLNSFNIDFDSVSNNIGSGIYIYTLKTEHNIFSKKMVLVK